MPPAATLEDLTMTEPRPYDDDAARHVWIGLRLIKRGDTERWWTDLAASPTGDAYLVDITPTALLVPREDAVWWAYGVADGHGRGVDLRAWADTLTVPELWTYEQAAAALGITANGVRVGMARSGELYSITLPDASRTVAGGREPRYVIAAQVRAKAPDATDADRREWWTIRAGLPTQTRLYHLPHPVVPAPDPDPLPVPRGATVLDRAMRALRIGDDADWFRFDELVSEGPGDRPRWARVRVDVAGGRRRRAQVLVPLTAVPPWVRGVADRRGLGDRVAYRTGMTVAR